MNTQPHASLIAVDSQPPGEIVRFLVDGVSFALDISGLTQRSQQTYRILSERGVVYEPVMTRCLTKLLRQMNEPRFMDIGACAGYYTCYVAALLGAHARTIYAVESNPSYCRGIRRSCEYNGQRNVKVCEAILSNVVEPAYVDGFSAVLGGAHGVNGTTTIPFDRLCERESIPTPNIVKMDIHGSEGKALFGMTSFLRNVDYLLLELHGQDRFDEFAAGIKRADALKLLWDLGLSVHYIAGHGTNPKQANQASIRSGRFAYRRLTPDNADAFLFDRLFHLFLLVTREPDVRGVLGDSVNDPFLCY